VSLDELVADSVAGWAAGAVSVHLHPNRADQVGTLAAPVHDAVVSAVRAAVPGLEISCSTAEGIYLGGATDRVAAVGAWRSPPDVVSLNLAEEGAFELGGALIDCGIGIEAVCLRWPTPSGCWMPLGQPASTACWSRRSSNTTSRQPLTSPGRSTRASPSWGSPPSLARRRPRNLVGCRRCPGRRPGCARWLGGFIDRPGRGTCAIQSTTGRADCRADPNVADRPLEVVEGILDPRAVLQVDDRAPYLRILGKEPGAAGVVNHDHEHWRETDGCPTRVPARRRCGDVSCVEERRAGCRLSRTWSPEQGLERPYTQNAQRSVSAGTDAALTRLVSDAFISTEE
jgi:beta-keto acid cleavage enzyme